MKSMLFAAAAATALSLAAARKRTRPPTGRSGHHEPGGQRQPRTPRPPPSDRRGGDGGPGLHRRLRGVTNAAISDMYEIQAGQIAQKKGQSRRREGLRQDDGHRAHGHVATQMKPLVTAAGKTPPTGLDERRKGLIDNLNAASPADFDKAYLCAAGSRPQRGPDPDAGLRRQRRRRRPEGAAAKAVPKVQAHLDHVKSLQAGNRAGSLSMLMAGARHAPADASSSTSCGTVICGRTAVAMSAASGDQQPDLGRQVKDVEGLGEHQRLVLRRIDVAGLAGDVDHFHRGIGVAGVPSMLRSGASATRRS